MFQIILTFADQQEFDATGSAILAGASALENVGSMSDVHTHAASILDELREKMHDAVKVDVKLA